MQRTKQAKVRKQLKRLRSEDWSEVFEAGTTFYRCHNVPIKPFISILEKFPNAHNREYAAYALISVLLNLERKHFRRTYYRIGLTRLKKIQKEIEKIIKILIKAQALETLGMSSTAGRQRHKLRDRIEKTVLTALSDESPEVRFWACYAAGQMKIKSALPKLGELAENEKEDWGEWWLVSEEAEDAIDWIHGRYTEPRIPISQRVALRN
jgi:hypothetical protein